MRGKPTYISAFKARYQEMRFLHNAKMDRKYLYIIIVGAVLFIGCELYPPWVYQAANSSFGYYPAGYSWRINPPMITQDGKYGSIIRDSTTILDGTAGLAPGEPLPVFVDEIRLRGQEILIIVASLAACLFAFNRRLFIAMALPGLFEAGAQFLIGKIAEYLWILYIGGLYVTGMTLFVVAACLSVLLLRGSLVDRFSRVYTFSVISASMPWLVTLVVWMSFTTYGTGYLFWLAPIAMLSALVPAALLAWPVTFFLYKSILRGRIN